MILGRPWEDAESPSLLRPLTHELSAPAPSPMTARGIGAARCGDGASDVGQGAWESLFILSAFPLNAESSHVGNPNHRQSTTRRSRALIDLAHFWSANA